MNAVAIDHDNPDLRAALARLIGLVAGQLTAAGETLANAHATPWQCVSLAARLDRLRAEADYLRKDVARLNPNELEYQP